MRVKLTKTEAGKKAASSQVPGIPVVCFFGVIKK